MATVAVNNNESNLHNAYYLAARARSKLTRAARNSDIDLRVLVSHANMLDNLMDSIHDMKVDNNNKRQLQIQQASDGRSEEESQKVQFVLPEKPKAEPAVELEWSDSDEEEDSDSDEYDSDDSDFEGEEEGEEEYSSDDSEEEIDEQYTTKSTKPHRTMPTIDEDYESLKNHNSNNQQKTFVNIRPPSPPLESEIQL